jgi:hypothetical protein
MKLRKAIYDSNASEKSQGILLAVGKLWESTAKQGSPGGQLLRRFAPCSALHFKPRSQLVVGMEACYP